MRAVDMVARYRATLAGARSDRRFRCREQSNGGASRKERSMKRVNPCLHARGYALAAIVGTGLIVVAGLLWTGGALAARGEARPGSPGAPYANMPAIAPIGVSIDKYLDLPHSAKGPAIDPAKGY